ncbi:MAG: hypothetical protein ABIN58_01625 [candidate division WOR-3 bacterium]
MEEKACRYCGRRFVPDPRVGDRQRACSLTCQRLRKQENNRRYRKKNPGYWKNHYEDSVKPWRQRHPEYQRTWRQKRKAHEKPAVREIQAEMLKKAIELTGRMQCCLREIQAEFTPPPASRAALVVSPP